MKANAYATLEVRIDLSLSEKEAVFLDALTGYGADVLLKVFKTLAGSAYLHGSETIVPTFCESVRSQIPAILERARLAREVFNGEKDAVWAKQTK